MMLKNLKMYYIVVLVLAVSVCNAKQQNRYLLDLSNIEPNSFEKLEVARRSEILSTIADQSYKILLDTPKTGLKDSNEPLKKIIETRKWLEKTNHITARTLALFMQWAVDSAVLNEMLRSELKKTGKPLKSPFKENSLDSETIKSLLNENQIDEVEYLNFALTLDSNAANYCKSSGYGAKDLISGKAFESEKDLNNLQFTAKGIRDGNEIYLRQNADIRNGNPFGLLFRKAAIKSKKDLIEYFLPMVINNIDEARDVRLIEDIYIENKGLISSDPNKLFEAFEKLIVSKSLKDGLERMTDTSNKWELKVKPNQWHSAKKIAEYKEEYYTSLARNHILNSINGRLQGIYIDRIKGYFSFFLQQEMKREGFLEHSNVPAGSLLDLKD